MRLGVGKHRPRSHNLPLYRALSFILSTALVTLPVLPAGVARASAPPRRVEPVGTLGAAPFAPPVMPVAPTLTATKVDSFPDPDNDGKAAPGETITYTVTITNSGPDDATNVQFNDTVDANTTLVPGSVQTQPNAANDTYNVLGNVRIQPNAASGLLANDTDPDTGNNAGLTATGPTTSAQGGDVTVNADGSFSYNPPPGFEGSDSFTYTVTDGFSSDTATVTFNVNEVVWFINNAAPPGGDGRLTSPYNSLASVNGADLDEPDDVIFVHDGAGPYDGGIVLENGQRLVGQGTSLDPALALFGISVPPHSDARPTATTNPVLANSGGNVITLAGGNIVIYVNASATAAGSAAIFGSAAGATTVSNVGVSASGTAGGVSLINQAGPFSMSNSTITANSSGPAVLVNGGATAIGFNNTAVSQNGGRVVNVQGRTGGAVTFDAASSVSGTNGATDAVSLLSNTGGAVTFAGPVQLNTNAAGARGLVADSGTVNLTNGSNAVSSTGAAAVDIENLTANINFAATASANSTGRGLRVDNVSGSVSFGNTSVNNSSNTGVLLTGNSAAVGFVDLDIAPAAGVRALHATDNTGTLTSTSGTIVTSGAVAVEITSAAGSPLNAQLTSVSATGGTTGIVLTRTTAAGSPGGFNVNGDGTNARNGSGGTITATTDDGVRLTNASGVVLRSMNLTNNGDTVSALLGTNESAAGEHAVEAVNSSGITLSGVLVQNPAASGLLGLELTGTNRINLDSLFTGINNAQTHGIFLTNSTANLTLFEINDSDFTNSNTGASMVLAANGGAANLTVEIENGCVFEGLNSQAVTLSGGATAGTTGTLTSTVNGNIFRNAAAGAENNVSALTTNGALHNATIEANLFDNIAESGLIANTSIIRTQNSGGRMTTVIKDNTVQNINYAAGGRHVIGHIFEPLVYNAANFSDLKIEGNTIANVTYSAANTNREILFIDYRTTASGGDIKIIGNNWNMPSPGTQEGMELRFRQTNASVVDLLIDNNGNGAGAVFNTSTRYIDIDAEAAATVNATVTNNNLNNSGTTAQRILDFETEAAASSMCVNVSGNTLPAAGASTIRLAQTAGIMNVTQASAAAVTAANGGATVTVVGAPTFGSAPCSLPTNARLELPTDAANRAVEVAATAQAQSGFSADRTLAAAFDKTPRGFANSENGQTLGFVSATGFAQPEPLKAALVAAPAALAGETINVNIGTLKAGDSVTITFQVTVADPFPTNVNPAQVSNQGTVTADGGIIVLTDDPSEAGTTNPTVTPILTPPLVNINDATVAEPASGSTDMLFTVTLSAAYPQTVTVNYQTANGGSNPATDGTDYTTSSGTVTFAAGETVKTIAVPVLADAAPAEGDETFLVNLSSPTNAIIGDGQATGTITDESAASQLIISELRTNGTNGANDDFVELLNTTDNDITVTASDGSGSGWSIVKSGADCNATPVIVGVVPEGTVIPARGNYLFTGSAYSLGGYATGDAALSADIELNRNVGLFSTANLANIGSANRLDAVGFGPNTGGNCDLLREGNTLGAVVGFPVDYAFVRKVDKGLTQDTNDNADDFIVVDTNGTSVGGGHSQRLGAPGPEGLGSPRGPVPCSASAGAAKFGRELIDPAVSAATAPNVIRDNTSNPAQNSTFGTLDFNRTWTNNTGAPVSRLRFRITNLSTFPSPSGTADLRPRTSGAAVVTTSGGNVTVQGTTLEQPPSQPNGGGINSSLSAGTITLGTPLADGASVNLRFLFGIQQTGDYDIGIVLESLPGSGKDFWRLSGHTENGGHTDGGCNNPPVANAGQDQTVECSNGQASVTLDGSGSTDPDGDTPLTYEWSENGNPLGTGQTLNVSLPVGSHTITLTVTDPSGDSSQDTVIVNVVDTQAPIVSDPPDVTVYTGAGASSCGAVVSDATLGVATATDSCEGSLPVNRTGVPSGNNFPIGTTVITYTATDSAGHIGSATQNVTVIDNTPPVISCPADITAAFDPSVNGAVVTYTAPTGTDNCAGATTVQTTGLPSGSTFPPGTTINTFVVTDAAGNTASCSFKVTVALTSIVGLDSVSLSGAAYVDSYDSNVGYPASKGSLASIVSNGTITMVGSTKVFGSVRSTQAGVVMSGASHVTGNATAGTTVSRTGSATVGGTVTNNAPAPAVSLPPVAACGPPYSPNSGISGTYSYNPATGDLNLTGINVATLANGTYCFRNVTVTNSAQLNVNGPVTIKITGTLNVSGAAKINNTTMIPGNLRLLSSYAGSNGVSLGNGSSSYLMVYAPQTGVTISGAGPLFGTVAGKTITLANSGALHYDTRLESIWPDIWTLLMP